MNMGLERMVERVWKVVEERFLRVYAYGRAVRLHSSLSSSHNTSSFFESNTTFMSTSSHSRGPSRHIESCRDSDREQINRQCRIGSIALKRRESVLVTLAFEPGLGSAHSPACEESVVISHSQLPAPSFLPPIPPPILPPSIFRHLRPIASASSRNNCSSSSSASSSVSDGRVCSSECQRERQYQRSAKSEIGAQFLKIEVLLVVKGAGERSSRSSSSSEFWFETDPLSAPTDKRTMIDGHFFNRGIGIGLVSGTWRVDGRCSTAGNVDGGSPVTVARTVVIEEDLVFYSWSRNAELLVRETRGRVALVVVVKVRAHGA